MIVPVEVELGCPYYSSILWLDPPKKGPKFWSWLSKLVFFVNILTEFF